MRGWIDLEGLDEKMPRFAAFPCLFVVGQLGYVRSITTALFRYCHVIHKTDRRMTGKGDVADFKPSPRIYTAHQAKPAPEILAIAPSATHRYSPVTAQLAAIPGVIAHLVSFLFETHKL